jgi:hypothetical protein
VGQFKRGLWDAGDSKVKPDAQLLVAVSLWLRTYDRDSGYWIGLENLIKILVPFNRELKLGLGVPALPVDRIVSSSGDIWRIIGPGKFVYTSDNWARELDMKCSYDTGIQLSVHRRWLEWALANSILMLADAGIPWHKEQTGTAPKTIGGIELAEFLK